MSVVSVDKDPVARTLTITAEFAAPAERVWRLWADPRKLERWWFPPGVTAVVREHDLTVGGRVTYDCATPDGPRSGSWDVRHVDEPRRIEFGLDSPGVPPTSARITVADRPGGTRVTIVVWFDADADMELLLSLGFDRGLSAAVAQGDALLGP
ncbi:MAG: SRPBCC domain-containing protein [Pseudonocardiaceae bacterium]|nr:MAG: SRPBCC domain-containing protein [Pseudonocardiaceae bacterium]